MSYQELHESIQARHIMSARSPEGCIEIGTLQREASATLERNGFDYGLVTNGGTVLGFVARASLCDSGKPLSAEPPTQLLTLDHVISETTPVSDVLAYLSTSPFQVVAKAKEVTGVVHVSDLNKHPVRTHLYLLLSQLEESLLSVLRENFTCEDDWKKQLTEARWGEVDSTFREAKKRNIDIDRLHYLSFSDYARILASDQEVLRKLGFQSDTDLYNSLEGMDELAEALMLANAKLVGFDRGVADLWQHERRIRDLVSRAELGERRQLLAVMFADIVDSVTFYEKYGDTAGVRMVKTFLMTLTPVITKHNGTHVKDIGDAVLVHFPNAQFAVQCAINMQRTLGEARAQTDGERIEAKVAITYGPVVLKGDDIFGDTVNLAARVLGYAGPNKVLVSDAVYEQIVQLPDVQLHLEHRQVELKGRKQRVDLYEVQAKGMATPALVEKVGR